MVNKKIDIHSVGYEIDLLICSNLKNWKGKEDFYNPATSLEYANMGIIQSFRANKIRNLIITKINRLIQDGPKFHFRNYHNY